MGKSSYTLHFPNFNPDQRKEVSPTKLNVEIEANEIFTKVREKNNFKGESVTTSGATFDLINEKIKTMKKNRDSRLKGRQMNIYQKDLTEVKAYEADSLKIFLDPKL